MIEEEIDLGLLLDNNSFPVVNTITHRYGS